MLFAAAGLLFIAFVSLAVVGISEAHMGVRRLEQELDRRTAGIPEQILANSGGEISHSEAEAFAEARFSSSLLSLSKAHSQARRDSQEPALDESSSSELVPLARSKSLVRES